MVNVTYCQYKEWTQLYKGNAGNAVKIPALFYNCRIANWPLGGTKT
jgi:hypothetical protein